MVDIMTTTNTRQKYVVLIRPLGIIWDETTAYTPNQAIRFVIARYIINNKIAPEDMFVPDYDVSQRDTGGLHQNSKEFDLLVDHLYNKHKDNAEVILKAHVDHDVAIMKMRDKRHPIVDAREQVERFVSEYMQKNPNSKKVSQVPAILEKRDRSDKISKDPTYDLPLFEQPK